MSRSIRLWLGLILGAAALLRFGGLDRRELWFDERTTAGVITGVALVDPIGGGGPFTAADFWREATPAAVLEASIREDAGNAVLYSLLLHGWSRLAGTTVGALRAPSALLGVLSVALVYGLARGRLSEVGALMAAALAALQPFLIRYSQEARSYSLAAFLALAATYFFLRIAEKDPDRPQSHAWVGYGLAAGAGLLTHYLSVYVLLTHAVWALFFLRDLDRWKHCIAAGILAGSVSLPWLLTGGREGASLMRSLDADYRFRAMRVAPGEEWALPVTPRNLAAGWTQMGLALTGNRLQSTGARLTLLLPLLGLTGIVAAGGYRVLLRSGRQSAALFLGLSLAGPLLSTALAVCSGHMISFSAHYASFGMPFALILLGAGLDRLWERPAAAWGQAPVALLTGVLGLSLLGSLWTVLQDLPGKRPPDPYAAAIGYLAKQVRPGDRVDFPSWPVARLCCLHLRRDSPWSLAVDPRAPTIRAVSPEGRERAAVDVPSH